MALRVVHFHNDNAGRLALRTEGYFVVYEPPSEQLVRQLTELQLCQPSDLRRARGRVRRLSFDLPAFDSVWIDSLVQLRLLTPYQARQLETGHGESLRIGPFVAIDELGRSPRGTTILARRLNRRDRCVIKRQCVAPDRLEDVHQELRSVLEQLDGFVHPNMVVPHEVLPPDDQAVELVSRYIPGLPLNQLLVRRGRFPATVVFEIGKQLLEGLAALHSRSMVHGDIRMSNIRLTESGLAVLVNGGIQPVLHPDITIHDDLTLDHYDGLAPELIGTGAAANASSELYALGCVLWQLLTGRPPIISADPLAKIAAHQTKTIDDVRVWAPDTPVALAESIRQLTAPDVEMRPRSFEDVLQHWGRPSSFSRSRLRQFRRLFDGAAPHFSATPVSDRMSSLVWTAATLFALVGGIASFYENGLRNELLSIARSLETATTSSMPSIVESALVSTTTDSPKTAERAQVRGLLPLPSPTSDGVIHLIERGPYEATAAAAEGQLIIRGTAGVKSEIQIGRSSLNLSAGQVVLEHVTIRYSPAEASEAGSVVAMVTARSQQLRIVNCEFVGLSAEPADIQRNRTQVAAIAWKTPNPRGSATNEITIANSLFHGDGASILLAQLPRTVQVENSLKTGTGEFLSLGPKSDGTGMLLGLDHVTLRHSGPLLWMAGESARTNGSKPIVIRASNCIFSLADVDSGLIVIDDAGVRKDLADSVEMQAHESVVEPGAVLLATFAHQQNRFLPVDADEKFEGLVASEINFVGDDIRNAADATIAPIQGPRTSEDARPGIDPALIGPTAG